MIVNAGVAKGAASVDAGGELVLLGSGRGRRFEARHLGTSDTCSSSGRLDTVGLSESVSSCSGGGEALPAACLCRCCHPYSVIAFLARGAFFLDVLALVQPEGGPTAVGHARFLSAVSE